jgi:hypothetical protein
LGSNPQAAAIEFPEPAPRAARRDFIIGEGARTSSPSRNSSTTQDT